MVVGTGMIAQGFKRYIATDGITIFASGVSDSGNSLQAEFDREKLLLQKTISTWPNNLLVYFSTCSIYQPGMSTSNYVIHKLAMEGLIINSNIRYLIIRLSNPIGKTQNKKTFLNFFLERIKNGAALPVWKNAGRNIMDLDDIIKTCDYIIENKLFENEIVNIANPNNSKIMDIVKELQSFFDVRITCDFLDKGTEPEINLEKISPVFKKLDIKFPDNYFTQLLTKYYPAHEL